MALPLLVLPNGFGSKGGIESLDMGTIEDDEGEDRRGLEICMASLLRKERLLKTKRAKIDEGQRDKTSRDSSTFILLLN